MVAEQWSRRTAHIARPMCIALALVALVGCGSNGDEAADVDVSTTEASATRTAVAVIATSLRETGASDPNGLQFTPAEAACAAEIIFDAIGPSRIEELGVDVDRGVGPELSEPPLTTAEGDAVFAAYDTCLDLPAQVRALLASDGSLTDAAAGCVADAYIASGIMREALLNPQFDQEVNDRIDAILSEAVADCSISPGTTAG